MRKGGYFNGLKRYRKSITKTELLGVLEMRKRAKTQINQEYVRLQPTLLRMDRMGEKTAAGYAGLFRALIAIQKCMGYMPKDN
jgi:hypothetical protein